MPRVIDPPPEDWRSFDGHRVKDIEFEITGGSTHETDKVVGDGDLVEIVVRAKCVNVKHPFKGDAVTRVQTLNVTEATIKRIVEKYVPPPEPVELPLGEGGNGDGMAKQGQPTPADA